MNQGNFGNYLFKIHRVYFLFYAGRCVIIKSIADDEAVRTA